MASRPTSQPVLTMDGIVVRFGGVVALDGVDLDVGPGEVLGVIGPNGAGKTTLFNVACGFVAPTKGRIHFEGKDVTGWRPHDLVHHGVARSLQGLGLFNRLSVLDNVLIGAERHARAGFFSSLLAMPGAVKDEAALRDRAMAVLDRLDIKGRAGETVGSLPYPLRKRVALARALVAQPRLLLLDEPAAGLSETEMSELGDIILDLAQEVSVMLVEHHMDLVMRVCDRLTVLDFGRVIAAGTPDEVRNDPVVLDAYLGASVEDPSGEDAATSVSGDAATTKGATSA
ncbi:ABC transporter ATP-binding protein [Janibacter cremeus]|uniref:ABC transporter ATP-binding protein n=1 Tax=Janibacter cremeus TaxID=1285192 RepID=UPI0023F8EF0B|nr:ABC transporter ATP-binding protein [Janibacter cremeus]WEV78492.1 ABC transporter ATP-binding protein [Janibacter cremeus]